MKRLGGQFRRAGRSVAAAACSIMAWWSAQYYSLPGGSGRLSTDIVDNVTYTVHTSTARATLNRVPLYYCTAIQRNIGFGFITVGNGILMYKVNVRSRHVAHTHLTTTRNHSRCEAGQKSCSPLRLY